jgi:hypothetical protein
MTKYREIPVTKISGPDEFLVNRRSEPKNDDEKMYNQIRKRSVMFKKPKARSITPFLPK